jgi:hypothetical protein
MTSHRVLMLRILANIDQQIAKICELLEESQTDEDQQRAMDALADLRDCELRAQAALKNAAR